MGLDSLRNRARATCSCIAAFVFGIAVQDFPVESALAFVVFHGLVWASFLVIAGVMLAFRRRMIDHGAVAVQQFGQDLLPLLLLFAISITGLMLTASYTWMRGYAYEFLAILHATTVIMTLLWLPFGKLFHVFQRPAQLGVSFYKDAGRARSAGRLSPLRAALRVDGHGPRPHARRAGARASATSFPPGATTRRCVRGAAARCLDWRRAQCGGSTSMRATNEREGSRAWRKFQSTPLRIIERFGPHVRR
jgi:hypothetical protein